MLASVSTIARKAQRNGEDGCFSLRVSLEIKRTAVDANAAAIPTQARTKELT